MKVTTAQRDLSLYGGTTSARAEAIATELRNAGLLPKGGRGLFAPLATADEIATFVLAVASPGRVADAENVALAMGSLVDRCGRTLHQKITDLITSPEQALLVQHVRILPLSKVAEVTGKTGSVEIFAQGSSWAEPGFKASSQGSGFVGAIGHIGAGVLQQLAIDFAQESSADEPGEQVG
jgi:hypothetical protein